MVRVSHEQRTTCSGMFGQVETTQAKSTGGIQKSWHVSIITLCDGPLSQGKKRGKEWSVSASERDPPKSHNIVRHTFNKHNP